MWSLSYISRSGERGWQVNLEKSYLRVNNHVLEIEQFQAHDRWAEREGYAILLFPSGSRTEARLFETGSDDDQLIFPTTQQGYGISRRRAARVSEPNRSSAAPEDGIRYGVTVRGRNL